MPSPGLAGIPAHLLGQIPSEVIASSTLRPLLAPAYESVAKKPALGTAYNVGPTAFKGAVLSPYFYKLTLSGIPDGWSSGILNLPESIVFGETAARLNQSYLPPFWPGRFGYFDGTIWTSTEGLSGDETHQGRSFYSGYTPDYPPANRSVFGSTDGAVTAMGTVGSGSTTTSVNLTIWPDSFKTPEIGNQIYIYTHAFGYAIGTSESPQIRTITAYSGGAATLDSAIATPTVGAGWYVRTKNDSENNSLVTPAIATSCLPGMWPYRLVRKVVTDNSISGNLVNFAYNYLLFISGTYGTTLAGRTIHVGGQTRTISSSSDNGTYTGLTFSTFWSPVPSVGDAFTIDATTSTTTYPFVTYYRAFTDCTNHYMIGWPILTLSVRSLSHTNDNGGIPGATPESYQVAACLRYAVDHWGTDEGATVVWGSEFTSKAWPNRVGDALDGLVLPFQVQTNDAANTDWSEITVTINRCSKPAGIPYPPRMPYNL